MTRQEQLELIRQNCIEANPKIDAVQKCDCSWCGMLPSNGGGHTIKGRPIRLADVLLAIHAQEKRPMYFNVGCDGGFYEVNYTYPDGNKCVVEHRGIGGFASWNLCKDDLAEQTDECIAFLSDLLA